MAWTCSFGIRANCNETSPKSIDSGKVLNVISLTQSQDHLYQILSDFAISYLAFKMHQSVSLLNIGVSVTKVREIASKKEAKDDQGGDTDVMKEAPNILADTLVTKSRV